MGADPVQLAGIDGASITLPLKVGGAIDGSVANVGGSHRETKLPEFYKNSSTK